jgi:hypothetical protein
VKLAQRPGILQQCIIQGIIGRDPACHAPRATSEPLGTLRWAPDPKAIGLISEGKQVRQWLIVQGIGLLRPAVVGALGIRRSPLEVCCKALESGRPIAPRVTSFGVSAPCAARNSSSMYGFTA